jgi:hypothetical protein
MKVGKWKQLAIPAHLICLFLPIAENAAAQLAGTVQRIMETHFCLSKFSSPFDEDHEVHPPCDQTSRVAIRWGHKNFEIEALGSSDSARVKNDMKRETQE